MTSDLLLFLKGLAMGAANVIPGVSGGTIALITGIYARLINAIKSFDLTAARLLIARDLRGFWAHVDGRWLAALLAGVAVSIVTLAQLFEYLLEHHERYTMAFFFGLILLSVVSVARRVTRWNAAATIALLVGTGIAVGIALLVPASENDGFGYLFLCGVLAISSMVLPGLSGSFVLIMLGNYALVLAAIGSFSLGILIPLGLGCAFGLVAFSHILAWVFDHFEQPTIALMTGFVVGSLLVIWPWKETLVQVIELPGKPPKEVVQGYDWFWPNLGASDTWIAVAMMVAGMALIAWMERFADDEPAAPATAAAPPERQ